MKNTLYILAVIFLMSACKTPQINVVNLNDFNEEKNVVIYNLPKTLINISVETEEIHKQKGPFYLYAKKYFGTDEVIKSDGTEYKISKIVISQNPIVDTAHYYAVIENKASPVNLVNLSEKGFLLGVNTDNIDFKKEENKEEVIKFSDDNSKKISYSDLTVWSVREAKYDTLYKEVFEDSVYVKMPILRKKMVFKTPEKKAEEMADLIFSLRDDKNALLKGENDGGKIPEGLAMKIMIEELNKLDAEYMSLFTGKSTSVKKYYNFTFVPESDNLQKPIFNFSKKYGILPAENGSGNPIIVKILDNKNTKTIKKYTERAKNPETKNGLFYRIPETVTVEILFKNQEISRKKILVSQLGTVNILPSEIFNENVSIEFYPETGALKRIYKK